MMKISSIRPWSSSSISTRSFLYTSGRMSFYGQGAGRYPTAYNVVQDLVDLLEGKGFYSVYGDKVNVENTECLSWYVRGNWTGEVAEDWGDAVITGKVNVNEMHAWRKENPDAFIAALAE